MLFFVALAISLDENKAEDEDQSCEFHVSSNVTHRTSKSEAGLVFLFNDPVCLEEGHKVEVDPPRPGEMEEPATGFFPNRAVGGGDFIESRDHVDVTSQWKSLDGDGSSVIR